MRLPDPELGLYSPGARTRGRHVGLMVDWENGLASIYLSCRAGLARAVRRIVRSPDVEDILQEAFVRSYEAGSRTPIRDARAFLLRTATNLALNHVTRAAYRTTDPLDELEESSTADPHGASPEQLVEADQRFGAFCRAVGSLPEQCRRVFVMKKVYGLTQDEIATRLGISASTVEKHIARGLLLCRERLLEEPSARKESVLAARRRA